MISDEKKADGTSALPGITRESCVARDQTDALRAKRDLFAISPGMIYLDGNSLGVLPKEVAERLAAVVRDEWGAGLISSWNTAGWIDLPARVGAKIAPLIGAAPDSVIAADSTSVNLFKMAAAGVALQRPRRVILTEPGNFPTDLYILQGLKTWLGETAELRIVDRAQIADALDTDVALLVLTHVHYKTGALHDMAALTAKAHAVGALTLWDLSHSAGALPVDLGGMDADLAVGCGYKFLNGGPGAPAFVYVAERLQDQIATPLSGWMGHAAPFDFVDAYRPASGIRRTLCGTPPVLALSALDAALDVFAGVAMADLRAKSMALGDLFLDLIDARLLDAGFTIACPRDGAARGSQVSLRHPQGYAIVQALIEVGVVGDFRSPDILRFGLTPLYVGYADVWDAVDRLVGVMTTQIWREPRFNVRAAVT